MEWTYYPFTNVNGGPTYCQEIKEDNRENYILDTLSVEYTQQAFTHASRIKQRGYSYVSSEYYKAITPMVNYYRNIVGKTDTKSTLSHFSFIDIWSIGFWTCG